MSTASQYVLIDVGNSYIEYSLYSSDQDPNKALSFVNKVRFETAAIDSHIDQIPELLPWIVSSVVPKIDMLLSQKNNHITFVKVGENLPLKLNVFSPNQVGADRIVNAVAAKNIYGFPCLIIDSGTAMTFCFVGPDGAYEGGSIFPGLGISSRALNEYTAKIPLILVKPDPDFIGKDTQSGVQSGLFWGFKFVINGFIAQYRSQYPGVVCIGTGNGIGIFKDHLDLDYIDQELIFKGLTFFAR